jgi:hypothetical protein
MIESINNFNFSSSYVDRYVDHSDQQRHSPQTALRQPADTVQISAQGREYFKADNAAAGGPAGEAALDSEQQRQVIELKQTDREVKAHEQAHKAAGGGLVMGGASYQYQRGPDGNMYAVSGEVKIDTSREKDPKNTIRKMKQVKQAALAPSQPSGQDRSVAARASQIETEARIELLKENSEEENQNSKDDKKSNNSIPTGSTRPYKSSSSEPSIQIVV